MRRRKGVVLTCQLGLESQSVVLETENKPLLIINQILIRKWSKLSKEAIVYMLNFLRSSALKASMEYRVSFYYFISSNLLLISKYPKDSCLWNAYTKWCYRVYVLSVNFVYILYFLSGFFLGIWRDAWWLDHTYTIWRFPLASLDSTTNPHCVINYGNIKCLSDCLSSRLILESRWWMMQRKGSQVWVLTYKSQPVAYNNLSTLGIVSSSPADHFPSTCKKCWIWITITLLFAKLFAVGRGHIK